MRIHWIKCWSWDVKCPWFYVTRKFHFKLTLCETGNRPCALGWVKNLSFKTHYIQWLKIIPEKRLATDLSDILFMPGCQIRPCILHCTGPYACPCLLWFPSVVIVKEWVSPEYNLIQRLLFLNKNYGFMFRLAYEKHTRNWK